MSSRDIISIDQWRLVISTICYVNCMQNITNKTHHHWKSVKAHTKHPQVEWGHVTNTLNQGWIHIKSPSTLFLLMIQEMCSTRFILVPWRSFSLELTSSGLNGSSGSYVCTSMTLLTISRSFLKVWEENLCWIWQAIFLPWGVRQYKTYYVCRCKSFFIHSWRASWWVLFRFQNFLPQISNHKLKLGLYNP